ncbi:FMN-binding negative transcriptional regulator [Ideonella sp. B508-1]|uniref:FMN-binding negative transcriptional regulator n=1 Tax=Ideonella sp. B508-1 TaxID=137716 RepID=UPI00034AD6AC|nr:FMN-binding negative transcriptional regulator [Ideonella sp. B508-1]
MYLPAHFAEPRQDELHRLIQAHPLGTLVSHGADGLDANHLPFLLDAQAGEAGTLLAHVARANPLWQTLTDGAPVLAIFHGPQGYISPSWYPGKQDAHRRVPTWNYEVVHAHGTLHVHEDEKFLRRLLALLTRTHEATQPQPWKMGDAPADYLAEQLQRIVGIELRITRLVGKRKLGQNHELRDREGAIQALDARGQGALAQAMRDTLP